MYVGRIAEQPARRRGCRFRPQQTLSMTMSGRLVLWLTVLLAASPCLAAGPPGMSADEAVAAARQLVGNGARRQSRAMGR